jgi:type II secretory pathway component PulM
MKTIASLLTVWRESSARERTAVLAASGLALAAALYGFLWDPGLAARKSLAVSLPQLRAQLEDMRRQRTEVAALRKELAAAPRQADLATLLRASAAQSPFGSALERIDALPDGKVRVQAASVPFGAWLSWIESLQRQHGIRVVTSRINALEQPGLVRVDASFAGAGAAAGTNPP